MSLKFSLPVIRASKEAAALSHESVSIKYGVTQLPVAPTKSKYKPNLQQELSKCGVSHTELRLKEIVDKQSQEVHTLSLGHIWRKPEFHPTFLEESYERCRDICAEYAKTFYLGTLLMTEERQKAIWAIYVWCRRTDELVDGPNAIHMSAAVLDRWEERLHDIFDGRPYDMLDAALTDTVYKFPIDIKPFLDMIQGMRMDTVKSRYQNFQELYLYCYYVAGTVGLMSVPVMGVAPGSPSIHNIYDAALCLGIVWCRRTDELVDGPNAIHMSAAVLDRWEERLHDIFDGRPYDMLDAALTDTVYKFPIDIKPFLDMIQGMRMDTVKSRYQNFQELYLYCYYVAGTVGLMSVPVMGVAPGSPSIHNIYDAALCLGIGNQLTNILRDVGEDTLRGRVYLPQDELAQYGLCDEDLFSKKVSDRYREFMKVQIERARFYFKQAEEGASHLDKASRWPVWSSMLLYRKILDAIEDNDYNNLTKRAYVGRTKKILMLPLAYTRTVSLAMPNLNLALR